MLKRFLISAIGPVMKSKSEELAQKLGQNDFKATDGFVVSKDMQVWDTIQEGTWQEGQW
jgi:hypothetical protein